MRFIRKHQLRCNSIAVMLFFVFASQLSFATSYQVELISPSEGPLYSRFNTSFRAEITRLADKHELDIMVIHASSASGNNNSLVVTVGNKISSQHLEQHGKNNTIFSLITREFMAKLGTSISANDNAFYTDFSPEQYLQLLHIGLPEHKRIGVIIGNNSAIDLEQLNKKATDLGLRIFSKRIAHERELLPELETLAKDIDAFLALPDKLVHNRRTARGILLTTYKHRIPVLAYSSSYVDAGATLSLFASPENIAIATANRTVAKLLGKQLHNCAEQTTVSIASNPHVANTLGVNIPSNESIRAIFMNGLEGCKP